MGDEGLTLVEVRVIHGLEPPLVQPRALREVAWQMREPGSGSSQMLEEI